MTITDSLASCCVLVSALVAAALAFAGCAERPSADSLSSVCGDLRLASSRQAIVGGDTDWDDTVIDLLTGQGDAVGAILVRDGGGFENTCTGTLVGPSAVLTAAHCIEDVSDSDDVRFAIGPDADGASRVEVASMHMHPDYDPFGTAENDVAVLILDEPAAQVVDGIRPIPYNCQTLTDALILDEIVQTVGYGCTDTDCDDDNTLRYWALEEVVSRTSYDFVVDGDGVQGVCYGDSGGPALWTMPGGEVRVLGTLSWGDAECGNRDHFAAAHDNCAFLDELVEVPEPEPDDTSDMGPDRAPDAGAEPEPDVGFDLGPDVGFDVSDDLGLDLGFDLVSDASDDAGLDSFLDSGPDPADVVSTADDASSDDAPVSGGDVREQPAACGSVTYAGFCDGDTAVWCQDGAVRRRRCDLCGQSCGWNASVGGYYCL